MIAVLLSASVLILVIILLRKLLRGKISLRVQYAIWLLVAIRLLIPIEIGSSPLSLQNFSNETRVEQPKREEQNTPIVQTPVQIIPSVPITTEPISQERPIASAPVAQTPQLTPPDFVISERGKETQHFDWQKLAHVIWFVGATAMAFWFVTVNVLFRTKAKANAFPLKVESFSLPVFLTSDIPSPCLVGLFRPRVYLTPNVDESAKIHVLTHEYTHYRHFDPMWSVVRALCLCVYWFHPLVWWAAILSKRDCELACDEGALKKLGEHERISYGETLLRMVTRASRPNDLLQTATTMTESKKQMKERVEMIVKQPKKLLIAFFCLVLVIGITVGCTFTGAESTSESTELTEPTEKTEPTMPTETTKPTELVEPESQLVSTYYEDGNYRIPQFDEEYAFYKKLNESIMEHFGTVTEGDTSEFTSIDYSCFQHGDVLSLLIIGENGTKMPVYKSYNIDVMKRDKIDILSDDLYENIHNILLERFIGELIERYKNTGSFSFDDATQEICHNNQVWHNYCEWLDQDGNAWVSFAYHPLDGSEALRWTVCPSEYSRVIPEWEVTTQVVELFSYEGYTDTCHIPFLLMSGGDALEVNAEILRQYTKGCSRCEFSWTIQGDILSLKIDAQYDYNEHSAYNLSVSQGTRLTAQDVYTAAGLSTEEYMAAAKEAIQKYHFVRYGGADSPISTGTHHFLAAADGGTSNIALAVPYFETNGELGLLARMFQIAGSSSQLQYIPLNGVETTQEYLDFLAQTRTELSLVPTFNQLGYEIQSFFDKPVNAQYFDAANTELASTSYPIYVDPYPVGHGGIAYEPTEEHAAQKRSKLQTYLNLLYGEGSYAFEDSESEPTSPVYRDEYVTAYGHMDGITVSSSALPVIKDLTPEQLHKEPVFEAALRYAGIDTPVIHASIFNDALNSSVEQYRYVITEDGDDRAFGPQVSIASDAQRAQLHIYVSSARARTQVSSTQSASILDIVEAIADYYPQYKRDSFYVELYYDSTVVLGYYVPCYRVYIHDRMLSEQYGMPTYAVFELCESRFPTNHTTVQPWVDE